MNKNYLLKLLKQFHEADGITNEMRLNDGFIFWLREYQELLLKLKEYYYSMGLSIEQPQLYELGKGPLDSIKIDDSKSISKYAPISSELITLDNLLLHACNNKIETMDDSNMFYTYNPYTLKDVNLVKDLSHLGRNITISAAGKIYDKDKKTKIKQLNDQFEDQNIQEEYEVFGDNYFYTLHTPSHTKNLSRRY